MTKLLLEANETPLSHYREDMETAGMPPVHVREMTAAGLVMDDGTARVTCCSRSTRRSCPPSPTASTFPIAPSSSPATRRDRGSRKGSRHARARSDGVQQILKLMSASAASAAPATSGSGRQPRGYDQEKFRVYVLKAHTSVEDAGRVWRPRPT